MNTSYQVSTQVQSFPCPVTGKIMLVPNTAIRLCLSTTPSVNKRDSRVIPAGVIFSVYLDDIRYVSISALSQTGTVTFKEITEVDPAAAKVA